MSSSSQTKYPKKANAPNEASVVLLRSLCERLKPMLNTAVYLSQEQLKDLGVECAGLDLDTGKPTDKGPRFLQLASMSQMETLAEKANLIDMDVVQDSTENDWHTMRFISYFYLTLFRLVPEEDHPDRQTILQKTPWSITNFEYIGNSTAEGCHWVVGFALKVSDKSMPDVVCFLGNEEPLRDDEIYTSELWCISRFGGGELIKKEYRHHQTAPVTVVSVSGRSLRVVQGYTDGRVVVRKSPIYELDSDDETNLSVLLKFAPWFLGHPCRE
ncbi:uncharacterized protein F4817DRAFT_353700 [Daldinia loculata]|uniref:uncharacterized protein n=1 Tax=Daldinia loculata TaxID=103429 RepID=UPI0020C1DFE4|nr:uncharacterized protein F4817DRAFT_353700 [Daldinia loculata]KAI1642172.1 hypothetical protein F4817DRAFT_353700 [Daldinia loculata]